MLIYRETRKEFKGQVTIVTFPFTRFSKKSPEQTGSEIGAYLQNELAEVSDFNVIKGFLNISLTDDHWLNCLYNEILPDNFAVFEPNGQKVMVEYSSPNTNKPLHLGHVRNNLLGFSVAEILAAAGYEGDQNQPGERSWVSTSVNQCWPGKSLATAKRPNHPG